MQVVDNLVVHRPAKLRMGMQHDCNRRVLFLLRVIAPFQAAFWAGKDNFGHGRPCLRVPNGWQNGAVYS